ncbi:MAG TPA: YceI family protein [Burkholderiaceae bacterium]
MAIAPVYAGDLYIMDAAHSAPQFEFTHLGMTTQTGRFDKAAGSVYLDLPRHSGKVNYEIDTASLNMGFGTESPDSPGFQLFRVAKFPKITYRSNHLIFNDAGDVVAAQGWLTMLGVSRRQAVDVAGFKCSIHPVLKRQICTGRIAATILRSQFGMLEYIPGISDKIVVTIPIEAYKN